MATLQRWGWVNTARAQAPQRIHGLVLGYEDLNDHDHLRLDPIHGLLAGKSDPLGEDRLLERDKGKALAAHSTLNRLELGAKAIDARYHKIQAQPDKIEQLLIQRGVKDRHPGSRVREAGPVFPGLKSGK